MTREIAGAGGESIPAVELRPPIRAEGGTAAEPLPGIVVAHDVDGPGGRARALAERLASEGFLVLLPDLRGEGLRSDGRGGRGGRGGGGGEGPGDRAAVSRLDAVLADLEGAEGVDDERLAVVGIGRGGTLAFLVGCTSQRPSAVVALDGPVLYDELSAERPTQPLELALNLGAPLLFLFGEPAGGSGTRIGGTGIDETQIVHLRDALSEGAKTFEIGACGALTGEGPPGEEASQRVLGFLRDVL